MKTENKNSAINMNAEKSQQSQDINVKQKPKPQYE